MIFAKCFWTTKGLSAAEMSTLGRSKHFSFSGTATKRNLAVMEINDYINNSASRWKIENRRNGIGQLLFHPISGISGFLDSCHSTQCTVSGSPCLLGFRFWPGQIFSLFEKFYLVNFKLFSCQKKKSMWWFPLVST